MGRHERRLVQYGSPSTHPQLSWEWVSGQLDAAGTYWVTAAAGPPHPRPVWGIWTAEMLHLSIGSPTLRRAATPGTAVVVHLDSGTDVVIVDGAVTGATSDPSLVDRYDAKYAYRYDAAELGPLTTIRPTQVLAWQSAGWAGRDGFTATGRWDW